MRTSRTFALLTMLLAQLSARSQPGPDELSIYFDAVRADAHAAIPGAVLSDPDQHTILERLTTFLDDSSANVRIKACEIGYRIASRSMDTVIHQTVVNLLVHACGQGHAAVTGVALNYLKGFHRRRFTASARERLKLLLSPDYSHPAALIRLVGFLQLSESIPQLKQFARTGNNTAVRWASLISLARMGDEGAAREMMTRVRRLPVNDHTVYNVFPDLVFSRSPEAISYLIAVVNSEDNNCLSADAEREIMIPCGYRVMEQLAPIIRDFPLERDSSGDLITADYPAALTQVRQWLRDNQSYAIIDESY